MTDADVVQFLRTVRYSDHTERNAKRAVSINQIARNAGKSRMAVYRTINGETSVSEPMRKAVENLSRLGTNRDHRVPHSGTAGAPSAVLQGKSRNSNLIPR